MFKDFMDISLSASAYKVINDSIQEGEYLRVGATSGGCSGWKWHLETESGLEDRMDDVFFTDTFQIRVNHDILHDVIGSAVIDYKTTGNLVEDGFIVRRIVAPGHECGCGESFTPISEIHGNKVTIDNV